MSRWNDARFDADRALAGVLTTLRPGATVTLAWYETQAELDSFNPSNRWPVAYHQVVTRAAQRILLKKGAKVTVSPITTKAANAWLASQQDKTASYDAYLKSLSVLIIS